MDNPPGLAKNPSTGSFLGLSRELHHGDAIDKIRKIDTEPTSKWFAVATGIGLAYRLVKVYQFSSKYPECPGRVISGMVMRGMEDYGSYNLGVATKAATAILEEARLLVTCSFFCFIGNSVRHEFGYRWFHQTRYDMEFKTSYLDLLGISPVLSVGSNFHKICEEKSTESPAVDDISTFDTDDVLQELAEDEVLSTLFADAEEDFDADNVVFFESPDGEEKSVFGDSVVGVTTAIEDVAIDISYFPEALESLKIADTDQNLVNSYKLEFLLSSVIETMGVFLKRGSPSVVLSMAEWRPDAMLEYAFDNGFDPPLDRVKAVESLAISNYLHEKRAFSEIRIEHQEERLSDWYDLQKC
jgi:hypothetical protein